MMVARVKADDRVVRSEPPTYVSIHVNRLQCFDSFLKPINDQVFQPREDTFTRTVSSQSLLNNDRLEELAQMSLYDRTLHMLAVDPMYQKEVALGKRIGFYRLGKELGAGNFSKVKLGIHVLTKEKVAVKIMDRTKMDTKAQRLLEREIKAMERMHHPNIIRLFECVETLTRTHLVLEYAGGGELYAYVHERGKLSEHEAKPLFAQIVAAVSHMHKNNLVHRDIKAENIMFSAPGVVKLVDFGFSCMLPSAAEQLKTFCGSPPYAAPELFRDESYNGPKVDIWALGVLLHFMLIGVTPFRGETVPELKSVSVQITIIHISMPLWRKKIGDFEEGKQSKDEDTTQKKIRTFMLEESNELGPRNSLIGTYRIVQYQVQTAPKEPVCHSTIPRETSERVRQLKNKSKTCVIV
ncbi:unnamed protein product [Haemonchus placei]|uniref:non-specific serine/threonine protein kinase n=1 Tax=Haemonchus placei TaxID=6290 RepID=A0A0N4X348_HAEPC|nr:unnamed protein product [Haemonchus placei]